MTKTMVFLGAGASKALGLPLTGDILPQLLSRLSSEKSPDPPLFGGDKDDQRELKHCLRVILPGLKFASGPKDHGAQSDTLPSITDVLSAIDYFLVSANAPSPDFTLSRLARARTLLERAVFELLVRNENPDALNMEMPEVVHREWDHTAKLGLLPQRPPDQHAERLRSVEWIMKLAKVEGGVTLISTNYDIEIEQGLYSTLGYNNVFNQVDFGTSVRDPACDKIYSRPSNASYKIFKLHGSLNWLRCSVCDNLYLNPAGAVAYLSFLLGEDSERNKRKFSWLRELEKEGANQCHCGYRPLRHVIVAPSFVRDVRDPILLEIWRNALQALREADRWIIVGYSLPPEDVAIRSLFLRAYHRPRNQRPEVVVVQKNEKKKDRNNGPEISRYELLFPGNTYKGGGLIANLDSL
jgi:NAD-dependent SIR2 family protein deacetylase